MHLAQNRCKHCFTVRVSCKKPRQIGHLERNNTQYRRQPSLSTTITSRGKPPIARVEQIYLAVLSTHLSSVRKSVSGTQSFSSASNNGNEVCLFCICWPDADVLRMRILCVIGFGDYPDVENGLRLTIHLRAPSVEIFPLVAG